MKQVNLRVCRMILPLLFGLFLSLSAYAQQVSVKGHVKDSTGEPLTDFLLNHACPDGGAVL